MYPLSMYSPCMMGQYGNQYQNLRAKYSCGLRDSDCGPYYYNNSVPKIYREPKREVQGNAFIRFLKAVFA